MTLHNEKPFRVIACLGTDHHPFRRLVDWLDDLAARRPDVEVVVQHGFSPAPRHAIAHEFLGYEEMIKLMREADVVVCHGGPGTIMDAQKAGHFPLVVPRDPQFDEHVDGHQMRFATVVADAGRADVATEKSEFDALIESRLANTGAPRTRSVEEQATGLGVLAAQLDELSQSPAPRAEPMVRAARRIFHR